MSDVREDGAPAFPLFKLDPWQRPSITGGMSLRDYLAAHSPVTWEVAAMVYGGRQVVQDRISNDLDRAGIFSVWAVLNYEYADAMIAQRKEK